MIKVAVIGCGYWGPNLIRNFIICPDAELAWICDLNKSRLEKVAMPYPNIKRTTNFNDILNDNTIKAVAIATAVDTHFDIAKACLEKGKHILIEKPLASNISQGEELVNLAKRKKLKLMCDHTFCYTGAVRKMKKIIDSGELGELLYFDSVRINLGLFQHDVNVVWDLAPHDLSILDFIIKETPIQINAHGVCHAGNDLENIAYVSIYYPDSFFAHLHLNWLSPVKIRKTVICGREKMLVWDDLEPVEKIKIYNKGIEIKKIKQEQKNKMMVSYRSGDIYIPQLDNTEALFEVAREFIDCIKKNRKPLTDGESGLRILKLLETAEKSIKSKGVNINI